MENFIGYLQLYFKIHTLESDTNNYIKWDSDFTILPTKDTMDHMIANIKNMMEQMKGEFEIINNGNRYAIVLSFPIYRE